MSMRTFERASSSRRVTWIGIVGLILLPAFVAGGLLWANWNPQNRLDEVTGAIVNADTAVTVDGQTVLLGRQLAAGLMSSTSDGGYTWELATESQAESGLQSGQYAVVVTIPEDFSAAATSFSGDAADARSATLQVTTSDVSASADPAISQVIARAAASALSTQLTSSYLSNVYVGFTTLSQSLATLADGATSLADGASSLATGTTSLADGLSDAADGAASLADGTSSLATGSDSLADGAKSLADGATSLANQTSALPASATALSESGSDLAVAAGSLADGVAQYAGAITGSEDSPGLASLAATLATGVDALATNVNSGVSTIEQMASLCPSDESGTSQLADTVLSHLSSAGVILTADQEQQIRDTIASIPASDACTLIGEAVTSLRTQASNVDGLSQLADGVSTGLASLSDSASGSGGIITGARSLAEGTASYTDGVSQLADGMPTLAAATTSLASGAGTLADGAITTASAAHALASGADTLADGIESAAAGASTIASGTQELASGAQTYADGVAEGQSQVPTYSDSERTSLADAVTAPVTVSGSLSAADAFGGWTAAGLIIVLALWIGALAGYTVLRPITARAIESSRTAIALWLQGLWPGVIAAIGSTAVLTAISVSVLDVGGITVAQLATYALACALAFVLVNHALAAAFGGPGRLVCVALAVVGTAGSIVSAVPEAFRLLAALSPLTPAIRGFAAIAAGQAAPADSNSGTGVLGRGSGRRGDARRGARANSTTSSPLPSLTASSERPSPQASEASSVMGMPASA